MGFLEEMADIVRPPTAKSSSGEILSYPTITDWLHDALRKSLDRDAVDAVNDAEFLLDFLKERLKRKLEQT